MIKYGFLNSAERSPHKKYGGIIFRPPRQFFLARILLQLSDSKVKIIIGFWFKQIKARGATLNSVSIHQTHPDELSSLAVWRTFLHRGTDRMGWGWVLNVLGFAYLNQALALFCSLITSGLLIYWCFWRQVVSVKHNHSVSCQSR